MASHRLPTPEMTAYSAGVDFPAQTSCVSNNYALEYCHRGRGVLSVNGTPFPIQAGDCFLTSPGCLLSYESDPDDPWATTWVMLAGNALPFYLENMGVTPDQPMFPFHNCPEVLDCLNAIRPMVNDHSQTLRVNRFHQNACANRLFAVIATLCDRAQAKSLPGSPQEEYIDRALWYLENVVQKRHRITVQEVADYVGLNRSYFSTLFRKITGKSPQQYLIELQMRQACILFTNPLSTASNVADTLGYEPSPFCRIFKRVIGMTPLEYKASLEIESTP